MDECSSHPSIIIPNIFFKKKKSHPGNHIEEHLYNGAEKMQYQFNQFNDRFNLIDLI